MNIFLVPRTWTRHLVVGLVTGGAALLTWWCMLTWATVIGPALGLLWAPWLEGLLLLGGTAAVLASASLLTEGSLRRQPVISRALWTSVAGLIAFFTALFLFGMVFLFLRVFSASNWDLVSDPSFVSLTHRGWLWGAAGFAAGFGALAARRFRGAFNHLGGGVAAAMLGAALWHGLGYYGVPPLGIPADQYLSTALGIFTWGTVYGLLIWAVPDELYAGWVRVLSANRFGHRIPIDRVDGSAAERFVGHFPKGLDLFLPADKGVAELHVSLVSDGKQGYAVRGLSQHPTLVRRFLERVDIRYAPARPAPLETTLQMEDIIELGSGDAKTVLEFVLLPKEER